MIALMVAAHIAVHPTAVVRECSYQNKVVICRNVVVGAK